MLSSVPQQPTVSNAARIYNYTLGGSYYYPVDQEAAEYMFSLLPSTRKWVRLLRDFLQHAARELAHAGFTQVIDFASGLPTEEHIHSQLPNARIVYSDIDADTVALAQRMLANLPNVRYVQHDLRDPLRLLAAPEIRAFLGDQHRVALGLSGVSSFLAKAELTRILQDLYDWAAPGSKLYITFETKQPGFMTPKLSQFLGMFEQIGAPFYLYDPAECESLIQPWQLPNSGLLPLPTVLGLPADYVTEADREGVGLEFYAAILEKPTAD